MAKETPIVELDKRTSTSKVFGIFDIKDGRDVVLVDDQEYLFDDLKKYFYGGIIRLDNSEIEVDKG